MEDIMQVEHNNNNNNEDYSSPAYFTNRLFAQHFSWRRIDSRTPHPPARSGAASIIVKRKLYIFGGYGGGTGRLDDFYSYDFEQQTWEMVTVLSDEKPCCRENNGVVISDSDQLIYLFGGYSGSGWMNDLWVFNIDTQRWTCIQESSDAAQLNESDAAVGDALIISALQPNRRRNSQPPVRGKIPSRRFGYVSVVHDNKLILMGGFDGQNWLNDMYVFDFATRVWSELLPRGDLPSARSCPAFAKDSKHIYLHGGYDGLERKADFFAFDLSTYTWIELPCLGHAPSPRYFHACCLFENKMFVYGGYSGSERLADMYVYDFETHHWSQIDCTTGDTPSGRSSLVAQIYGNSLYVLFGYDGNKVLNDFYRFRLRSIGLPSPELSTDLSKLINNAELSDVVFSIEGKRVYACRSILAIRSEYFRVMLCGGMKESLCRAKQIGDVSMDDANKDQVIEIPDVSYEVFMKVLEYLYTDAFRKVSLETALQLLIASEQFLIKRLKALCEDYICSGICVENVVHILLASHQYNAAELKELALEFVLHHLKDPIVVAGLDELKAEPDLLVEIVKRTPQMSIVERRVPRNQPFGNSGGWNER